MEHGHLLQQPLCHSGLGTICEEGTGAGEQGQRQTQTRPAHTLPTQTGMQIPSPSQNAPPGIICEQKCSRQAVSASVLSLLATPASRQPAESRSYLFAMAAEANGSTMAPSARVRHGFLSGPIPPALFTSTISRTPER